MVTTIPDPYARVMFHGKVLDNATVAALKLVEQDLGYELTILQGVGGATASAGTHLGRNNEGGRAVDLSDYDAERKIKALKKRGFAVWLRYYQPGLWGGHIHAVLIFKTTTNARGIAASALRQIGSFLRRRNGLVGDGPDDHPYRVSPQPIFTLADYAKTHKEPVKRPEKNNITRTRDRLVEAIAAADQAASLLDDVDPKRVKARAQLDEIRAAKRALQASLDVLPKK